MSLNIHDSVNGILSIDDPTIVLDNSSVPSSFSQPTLKLRKQCAHPIDWSPEMNTLLLHELVQAIRTGKRSDNGFAIEVWNLIAGAIRIAS